jgi:glycosyltransferase involved in cell wall biosynthesis
MDPMSPTTERPTARTLVVAQPGAELYGSDRQVLQSVAALSGAGWRVVVVLPTDGPLVRRLWACGAEVRFLEFPVLRKSALSPAGLLQAARELAAALPGLMKLLDEENPALVYVNTLTIPIWLLAAAIKRQPSLCHLHEAEIDLPLAIRVALTAPLTLTSRVIANSRATLEALPARRFGLRSRARVVHNGVPGPSTASELRPTPPGRVRILLVGRISPRKGTAIALAAVRELCRQGYDVGLEIVGGSFPGYEWFHDRVTEAANAPDLAGRVTLSGFMDDVWSAFDRSDIVIVPSSGESFGNVAVEGMLAGRPVVASATQGLAEIIVDGESGKLVPPGDAAALAAAIRSLCDDWELARRLGEAGRVRAHASFSPERYAREVCDIVGSATWT